MVIISLGICSRITGFRFMCFKLLFRSRAVWLSLDLRILSLTSFQCILWGLIERESSGLSNENTFNLLQVSRFC